jgi:hypothetical protein
MTFFILIVFRSKQPRMLRRLGHIHTQFAVSDDFLEKSRNKIKKGSADKLI